MIVNKPWSSLQPKFVSASPFNHVIIDNFWEDSVAQQLVAEIPDHDSIDWTVHYQNALEDKKACNHWDRFPATTYRAFTYLNSPEFVKIIEQIVGHDGVLTDIGLHGGGWHSHHKGGKLNVHLDYSIHPKLKLQRHYNLIIYMTPDWNKKWNGGLELWSHNLETNQPKELIDTVENRFNRAVLFDTTQNAWHGLPENLTCPDGVYRKSMAVYYLTQPKDGADQRRRALFVPHGDQAQDPTILELIKKRTIEIKKSV